MSIRTILREIIRSMTFWIPTNHPPKWILTRVSNISRKASDTPGGIFTKYFDGKNRLYKVKMINTGQHTFDEKYYWKPKIR
jgi:hypothetical protein